VETKPCDRKLARRAGPAHEQRPKVTGPAAVGGEAEEFDPIEAHPRAPERAPRGPFVSGRVHQYPHDLRGCELADDLRVNPRDRAEPARPVALVVGPPDPRGMMPFPLGGHAKPERGNRPHAPLCLAEIATDDLAVRLAAVVPEEWPAASHGLG